MLYSCIIVLIILILCISSKNNFVSINTPKWAIFTQIHHPIDLDTWLKYHLKLNPDKIYINIENDPELKVPIKSKKIVVEYSTTNQGSWGNDLDIRLQNNFNKTAKTARKDGIEWMIKIDEDELLFSPDGKRISNILSNIDTNSIRLKNYEAFYPNVNKDPKFCFSPDVVFARCDKPGQCSAYGNGKSFGRISNPKVLQFGSHYFRGPNISNDFLPIEDLVILHFESCNFQKWKHKFGKMYHNNELDKQLHYRNYKGSLRDFLKSKFPQYYKSVNVFGKGNLTEQDLVDVYSGMRVQKPNNNYQRFKFF